MIWRIIFSFIRFDSPGRTALALNRDDAKKFAMISNMSKFVIKDLYRRILKNNNKSNDNFIQSFLDTSIEMPKIRYHRTAFGFQRYIIEPVGREPGGREFSHVQMYTYSLVIGTLLRRNFSRSNRKYAVREEFQGGKSAYVNPKDIVTEVSISNRSR